VQEGIEGFGGEQQPAGARHALDEAAVILEGLRGEAAVGGGFFEVEVRTWWLLLSFHQGGESIYYPERLESDTWRRKRPKT
jgi:hypothetical protein